MDYVCDTNVWYEVGNGHRDPSKFKLGGNRLLATGISAMEISTRITVKDFLDRKRAAQAVLIHADNYLKDPEYHLAELWGLTVPSQKFDWKDVFRAIAAAANMAELDSGVSHIMSINTQKAAAWRKAFSDEFVTDTVDIIKKFCPTYADDRKTGGTIKYVKNKDIMNFKKCLSSSVLHDLLVPSTRDRAAGLAPTGSVPEATQEEIDKATPLLLPFAKAYAAYLVKVATKFGSEPNDWGDMHCFVYIQDGRKMLTAEKRWLEIAQDAGLASEVVDSKTF